MSDKGDVPSGGTPAPLDVDSAALGGGGVGQWGGWVVPVEEEGLEDL